MSFSLLYFVSYLYYKSLKSGVQFLFNAAIQQSHSEIPVVLGGAVLQIIVTNEIITMRIPGTSSLQLLCVSWQLLLLC